MTATDSHAASPPAAARASLPGDLIGELLLGMRLRGVSYHRVKLTPPFGLGFHTARDHAQFHFVAQGPVHMRTEDGTLHVLQTDDAVLLPRGGRHDLLSAPDIHSRDITCFKTVLLCDDVRSVCDGAEMSCGGHDTLIFSGCMEFDLGGMHPLVELMPGVMRVGTLLDRYPEIRPMLEAMEREARSQRAGSAAILARLADVVAAHIVRGWVECGCGDATGWVEALRDPRLGRVIAALHRDPGRNWTLNDLASEMGRSRAVFSERFLAATGTTPHRYLTDLRMRLAEKWIGRDRVSIEDVAERLGYGSQAAFSRAFKRTTGQPPGAARAKDASP
ncbi:RCS-specific HTH-type transcriptional activator RclR [Castellaniella defragrans]